MTRRVVLDAAAFDRLDGFSGGRARALLGELVGRGAEAWCSAVTVAEVSRGTARSARVAAALSRPTGGERINVQVTDLPFARLVGTVLHASGAGSEDLADAHVVAICLGAEASLVVTSDPDDILRLADPFPGLRILVRQP